MLRKTLLLPFLLLGACAPAVTTAPPAPVPPAATPAKPAEPEPANGPASAAPPSWWLMATDAAGAWGAGVERAYRELLAGKAPRRTVVVAVIDSGVDGEHDDLDANLWVNPGEVAGNGRDDDGNGYVDDVHGWNFLGGRDGRHVEQDTYEVTRLFAQCRQRAEGGQPAYAPPPEACGRIEADYRERLRENEEMLAQLRGMSAAVADMVRVLERELDPDTLTLAGVRALRPIRNDARMAQLQYLQLAEHGITPELLEEERQRLEDLSEYGLNPAFDPRGIVGDDYLDLSERGYGNPQVAGPDASHGTGVAGIIGAERGNGLGSDGIAPAVRIMALRAVPDGDERDKDVANAIRYAADNGAHIINMSFGKAYSPFKQVVDEAVRHAESRGVLLVHAAGNEGANLAEESNFPNPVYADGTRAAGWIEVGASGWYGADRLAADFTNYGADHVDVFAPGVDIYTADTGDAFQTNSGTSFAAPVVSGIAALIMAYYPELSAQDVRRAILESATPLREQPVVRPGTESESVRFGELSRTGALVNAYEALRVAERLVAQRPRS